MSDLLLVGLSIWPDAADHLQDAAFRVDVVIGFDTECVELVVYIAVAVESGVDRACCACIRRGASDGSDLIAVCGQGVDSCKTKCVGDGNRICTVCKAAAVGVAVDAEPRLLSAAVGKVCVLAVSDAVDADAGQSTGLIAVFIMVGAVGEIAGRRDRREVAAAPVAVMEHAALRIGHRCNFSI